MKIVVVNGSPKGESSNTNVMANAFLKGAKEAEAETVNVFLSEKEIQHCKGCFACWFKNKGQCIIDDQMKEVLSITEGGDILVLATPLYFDNISGMLKVFMDRLVVLGDPHFEIDEQGETRHVEPVDEKTPKLVMMSNCGFSEESQFQVVSKWANRVAHHMHTEIIGEIYTTQGTLLANQVEELKPIISGYLEHIKRAGKEIATDMKLSEETKKLLNKNFIPKEIYVQESNRSFDMMLDKS
ncbi:flavodoxin family protein [Dethiothermospora halolimnae]|uniref:flavodoxin family protein n=1 Tax=Dethiothermospora halolimnae TaxID=3114390 RepID=UPI003CCC1347